MYEVHQGDVCYRRMLVDRADPDSFVPLAWGWAKDRRRVYLHGCLVDGAQPESFVPFDAAFGRDAGRVYGGCSPLDADPATFRVLRDGYAADATQVFYGELRLGWLAACWTIETAHASSFTPLTLGWAIDRAHAYCAGGVAPDADPGPLVPLTRRLASDGTQVHVRHRALDADPATFRALDEHYGVDAGRAYFGDILARTLAADRATFRVLGHDFAADRRDVYWKSELLAGVEPASLRVLSNDFACDDQRVMYFYSGIHGTVKLDDGERYGTKPIVLDGADPATFRDTGELYGVDARRAYHHSAPIALVGDARRFETLGARLARDDQAVYYEGDVVADADPATFRIIAPAGLARDRHGYYRYDAYGEYPQIAPTSQTEAHAILDGELDPYGYDEEG